MMDKQNDGIELGRQKIEGDASEQYLRGRSYLQSARQKMDLFPVLPRPLKGYCREEEQPLGIVLSVAGSDMPAFSANGKR